MAKPAAVRAVEKIVTNLFAHFIQVARVSGGGNKIAVRREIPSPEAADHPRDDRGVRWERLPKNLAREICRRAVFVATIRFEKRGHEESGCSVLAGSPVELGRVDRAGDLWAPNDTTAPTLPICSEGSSRDRDNRVKITRSQKSELTLLRGSDLLARATFYGAGVRAGKLHLSNQNLTPIHIYG